MCVCVCVCVCVCARVCVYVLFVQKSFFQKQIPSFIVIFYNVSYRDYNQNEELFFR